MPIPKIIHYCWFGRKEKPDSVKKCIESWKKNLPDYQLMEWNEDNFDVNRLSYTKDAYEARKYAFVSDVARVHALLNYGGIYMDTDVEVLKSFDSILDNRCVLGIEEREYVATSMIAAEKNHPLIVEFVEIYKNLSFYDEEGNIIPGTNVQKLTNMLLKTGYVKENVYQELDDGICIYPKEYFSPYDYINCYFNITDKTICVHHFFVSWMPWQTRAKKMIKQKLVKIIGVKGMNYLRYKFFKNK